MLGLDIGLLESYYDYTVIVKPKNNDLAVLFESMDILGDPV